MLGFNGVSLVDGELDFSRVRAAHDQSLTSIYHLCCYNLVPKSAIRI
jgi:hypothetical protein